MNWRKETKYNVISDCGRYRICWCGTAKGLVYVLSKGNDWVHSGTKEECKAMAEKMSEDKAA